MRCIILCILQICTAKARSSLGTLAWTTSPKEGSDKPTAQCHITVHIHWSQLPVSGPDPTSSYWLPGPLLCGKRRHKSSWTSIFPLEAFLLPKLDKLLWCPPEECRQPWHTPGDAIWTKVTFQSVTFMLSLIKSTKSTTTSRRMGFGGLEQITV